MLIVYLLVIVLALWIALFKYRRRRMYMLAAKVPAPLSECPLIGIAHTLVGDTEHIMKKLQEFSYEAMQRGGIVRVWLGHILYFITVDAEILEMVLKTQLEKDDLHRFMQKGIGNGGIFAPVSIWRRRRKIMLPTFSPKIVENFVEVFSEQSFILSKKLEPFAGTGQFSIWTHLSSYTLDSVCETAMGIQMKAQDNPSTPFLFHLNRILQLMTQRIFHLWLQPDWMYKLFPQYTLHEESIRALHQFTDEIIQKKREEITKEKNSQPEADNHYQLDDHKTRSFLDLLILLSGGEKGYSNEELREEVLTLIIAGTDTSAVGIGYTLKLLAMYPHVQDKVYAEVQEVLGDSDRRIVKEDLPKLKYQERVLKESLRLFPPVPFIIRKILTETKLPSGTVLPAGSGVVASIWGTHRNPKYWGPDADVFDPDRFLPERLQLKNPCSFMPFSNGPRNCLGYQYALMSMKTALSTIIRNYRVVGDEESSPAPYMKVKLNIMMKAVDNYTVGLEKRER